MSEQVPAFVALLREQKKQAVILGVLVVAMLVIGARLLLSGTPDTAGSAPARATQSNAATATKAAGSDERRPIVEVPWPDRPRRDLFAFAPLQDASGQPATHTTTRKGPTGDDQARQAAAAALSLEGTVRGDRAGALINGRFVKAGGDVSGFVLKKVGKRHVVLEMDGHAVVLKM